ncbi:hypothetical protein GCM10008938_24200 [Deinococcus roseus]|uniref:Uncharacterized protein n=1 Tax=Deinococcus roseus TaxID=392414 RepID=A0ABQ2D135_9DEIO|nr:hypothetical protein GCM10008938_24200 [Deinococcus roseus]
MLGGTHHCLKLFETQHEAQIVTKVQKAVSSDGLQCKNPAPVVLVGTGVPAFPEMICLIPSSHLTKE